MCSHCVIKMCFTGGLKACLTSYYAFPADKAKPPLCYYQGTLNVLDVRVI